MPSITVAVPHTLDQQQATARLKERFDSTRARSATASPTWWPSGTATCSASASRHSASRSKGRPLPASRKWSSTPSSPWPRCCFAEGSSRRSAGNSRKLWGSVPTCAVWPPDRSGVTRRVGSRSRCPRDAACIRPANNRLEQFVQGRLFHAERDRLLERYLRLPKGLVVDP